MISSRGFVAVCNPKRFGGKKSAVAAAFAAF
jgi:hypothetical protein